MCRDGFLTHAVRKGRGMAKATEMKIGYARVSTIEQNLNLQRDALKAAGCGKIIEDKASGGKVKRDGLERVLEMLRQGDTLAVWRLDRLGRSLKHLIELMSELEGQGIGFQSTTEAIDTTTPGGKLVFHIFAALAEFDSVVGITDASITRNPCNPCTRRRESTTAAGPSPMRQVPTGW